jgi:hypothetical protein
MLLDEFRYLLSKIEVIEHPKRGASIKLIDWEHHDYIDDVLCEKFDLDYASSSHDEVTGSYIMYFDENVSSEKVNAVVNEINRYHFENDKEYNVE